jgi:hypothetical protein
MFRQPVVQNLKTGSEWSSSILFSLVQELIEFWGDGKLEGELKARMEELIAHYFTLRS